MDELKTEQILATAKILMEAAEGERMASKDYFRQLNEIYAVSPELGDKCADVIAEIIADEMNHDKKLGELVTELSGIEPKKD